MFTIRYNYLNDSILSIDDIDVLQDIPSDPKCISRKNFVEQRLTLEIWTNTNLE